MAKRRSAPAGCWACHRSRIGKCVRHQTPDQHDEYARLRAADAIRTAAAQRDATLRLFFHDLWVLITLEAVFAVIRPQYPLKSDDWVRGHIASARRTPRWRRVQNAVVYLMANNPARRSIE